MTEAPLHPCHYRRLELKSELEMYKAQKKAGWSDQQAKSPFYKPYNPEIKPEPLKPDVFEDIQREYLTNNPPVPDFKRKPDTKQYIKNMELAPIGLGFDKVIY